MQAFLKNCFEKKGWRNRWKLLESRKIIWLERNGKCILEGKNFAICQTVLSGWYIQQYLERYASSSSVTL